MIRVPSHRSSVSHSVPCTVAGGIVALGREAAVRVGPQFAHHVLARRACAVSSPRARCELRSRAVGQPEKFPPVSVATTSPSRPCVSTNSPSKNSPVWVPPLGTCGRHAHAAVRRVDHRPERDLTDRRQRNEGRGCQADFTSTAAGNRRQVARHQPASGAEAWLPFSWSESH